MPATYVYDKGKYHDESIEELGLTVEHAANHTVVFLRWLIERQLMDKSFIDGSGQVLENYQVGKATIHDVYDWWDRCLIDEMLSAEANRFAIHYFDFDKGMYLQDYAELLQGSLPSVFHIDYTEENYQSMKQVIDRRYSEWKSLN